MTDPRCIALNAGPNVTLYHSGPPLDHGPLPSLFYFALSGPDSLSLDPFNQPVQFLKPRMIRVFSLTLPAHENGLPPTSAIQTWADDYARGLDPLGGFLDECQIAVEFATKEKFADPEKLAAAGLSRGGLICLHLAARDPRFRAIAAFAPVTKLTELKEFHPIKHLGEPFNAEHLRDALFDRHIRFYIGNQDTRVGTRHCFDFAMALADAAHKKKIRSPQIEMIMSPSIGKDGHGTSPEAFRHGADWLASYLNVK